MKNPRARIIALKTQKPTPSAIIALTASSVNKKTNKEKEYDMFNLIKSMEETTKAKEMTESLKSTKSMTSLKSLKSLKSKFLKAVAMALILSTLCPMLRVNVFAVSPEEGANWARSQIGQWIDFDGVYGAQCVDLTKSYYAWLDVGAASGNGKDYWTNALPAGWVRIANTPEFIAQPGDIAVWNGNVGDGHGHVAIVLSATLNSFVSVDQNWVNSSDNGSAAAEVTHNYNDVIGIVRPNFSGGAPSNPGTPGAPSDPGAQQNPPAPSMPNPNPPANTREEVLFATFHDGTGACKSYKSGSYPYVGDEFNDQYAHALTRGGLGAILFEHRDFGGNWMAITDERGVDLEREFPQFNKSVSSLIIADIDWVRAYEANRKAEESKNASDPAAPPTSQPTAQPSAAVTPTTEPYTPPPTGAAPQSYSVTGYDLRFNEGVMKLTLSDGSVLNGAKIAGTNGYSFILKGDTTLSVPDAFIATTGADGTIVSGNAYVADENGSRFVRAFSGSVITGRYGVDIWWDPGQYDPREAEKSHTVTLYDLDFNAGKMNLTLDNGKVIAGNRILDNAGTGRNGYSFALSGQVTLTVPNDYIVTSGADGVVLSGSTEIDYEGDRAFLRAYSGAVIKVRYGCDFWYEPQSGASPQPTRQPAPQSPETAPTRNQFSPTPAPQSSSQTDFLSSAGASEWAVEEVREAIRLGIAPEEILNEYQSDTTRAEFCRAVIRVLLLKTGVVSDEAKFTEAYCVDLSEDPFTDTSDRYIKMAYSLGIVEGIGNGKFSPDTGITRQEAATMLMKAAAALQYTAYESPPVEFADVGAVASWARRGVEFTSANRIMNGVGASMFAPHESYTREQTILSMLRLYKSFPREFYSI